MYAYSHSVGNFYQVCSLNNGQKGSIGQVLWSQKKIGNYHSIAISSKDKGKPLIVTKFTVKYNDALENIQLDDISPGVNLLQDFIKDKSNKNFNLVKITWNSTYKEIIILDEAKEKYIISVPF